MTRAGTTRRSYRAHLRHVARSATFPRWITVPFVLIFGLILWLGVVSDAAGRFPPPSTGSILYLLAVIGLSAFLAYADRDEDTRAKDHKRRLGHKRRPGGKDGDE